jgi:signal transduction histidine kinase
MKTPRPLLRRRVALWFGSSVFVVVALAALLVRGVLRDALEREFAAAQDATGALVHAFFRSEVADYKTVEATVFHVAAEHVFAGRAVDFLRPDGSVMDPYPEARRNPPPQPASPLRIAAYPLDRDLAPGWTVRVTASGAALAESQRRVDLWLFFTVLGAGLAAAAIGWAVTGAAMRPVRLMTDAAETMGPERPDARLPIADPHDELGRLAQRFNALLDRLDGALSQQRRFLAVAAHELRTPIARMRSEIEVARLPDGDAATALAHVEQDLLGAARLVDTLLQLARADAAPYDVKPVRGFLDDRVAAAAERWEATARQRGVRLVVEELAEAPSALDAPYVDRLLDVLLDNAIRYTPREGSVTLRAEPSDGGAVVTVRDTGIGIPADDVPHLFDRFWRGAEARRHAPDGSGLGLALAKWIADAHEATITVESAVGAGTTIRVHFPAAAPPAR